MMQVAMSEREREREQKAVLMYIIYSVSLLTKHVMLVYSVSLLTKHVMLGLVGLKQREEKTKNTRFLPHAYVR